jgi:hypothetical protein
MEQLKEFLIQNAAWVSNVVVSAISVIITAVINHFVNEKKRHNEIDDEKFKEVISPCMIKLEPVLYKNYSIETIEKVEEICNKKPHLVSVQVFQWLTEAKEYLSDENEKKDVTIDSFNCLCSYFSNEYNRLLKYNKLIKKGIQYKMRRKQYYSTYDKLFDIVTFIAVVLFLFCSFLLLFCFYVIVFF